MKRNGRRPPARSMGAKSRALALSCKIARPRSRPWGRAYSAASACAASSFMPASRSPRKASSYLAKVPHARGPSGVPGIEIDAVSPLLGSSDERRRNTPVDATPRIGPFSILAPPLERAGCVVYRCRDDGLPRELALKAVRPEAADPATARRRLWREAEVRAVLNHPHALPLYRAVRSRGGLLLVGPWLPGGSLEGGLGAPLRPADLLAVADGVGGALDALHAAGWWHGDVSAGNVLFAADGRAVLIDFGAARRLGEPLAGSEVSVTPYTAAPEVWDRAPVDGRSDLYSLGVLLYLVLTG